MAKGEMSLGMRGQAGGEIPGNSKIGSKMREVPICTLGQTDGLLGWRPKFSTPGANLVVVVLMLGIGLIAGCKDSGERSERSQTVPLPEATVVIQVSQGQMEVIEEIEKARGGEAYYVTSADHPVTIQERLEEDNCAYCGVDLPSGVASIAGRLCRVFNIKLENWFRLEFLTETTPDFRKTPALRLLLTDRASVAPLVARGGARIRFVVGSSGVER